MKKVVKALIGSLLCSALLLPGVSAAAVHNNSDYSSAQQRSILENYVKSHPLDKSSFVTRPESKKIYINGKIDLTNAPASIGELDDVRVDYENDPVLMYPDTDPNSWGRHLLGIKHWYRPDALVAKLKSGSKSSAHLDSDDDSKLILETHGYATEFTDQGDWGCAVPYFWDDVKRGDTVDVDNLEGDGQSISPTRDDFGPNQQVCPSHIVDLGSSWDSQLGGNGLTYVDTFIWIRGGVHY